MKRLRIVTLLVVLGLAPRIDAVDFFRGDANNDGGINIADAIYTLMYLFSDGLPPPCMDSADVNDDGTVDVADAIFHLGFLKPVGTPLLPPPPFQACGEDPTSDALDCAEFVGCP